MVERIVEKIREVPVDKIVEVRPPGTRHARARMRRLCRAPALFSAYTVGLDVYVALRSNLSYIDNDTRPAALHATGLHRRPAGRAAARG